MILKVPIGLKKPPGLPQISLIKVGYINQQEVLNGGSIMIQDKIFVISSYTRANTACGGSNYHSIYTTAY